MKYRNTITMQCKMYKDQTLTKLSCHLTINNCTVTSQNFLSSYKRRDQVELWLSGCLTSFNIGFQFSNQLDYS